MWVRTVDLPTHARPPKHWFPALLIAAGIMTGCATPFLIRQTAGILETPQEEAAAPVAAQEAAAPKVVSAAANRAPEPDFGPLQAELEAYLTDQHGTYGVYVIDLASAKGFGINADQVFPAASTFKLPMAMYILDRVDAGEASLDEQLAYSAEDWEEGTGILQEEVGEGVTFPVGRLIKLAITQSDNIATNMLVRRFGQENIFAYMNQLGGDTTIFDGARVGTTPREMALYMWQSRSNSVMPDDQLRRFLLESLANTAFTDRVAAGVPKGVKVAHKIGTLPGVVNDVALVYAPRRTFVVSVFSMDVAEEVGAEVIAEVTRKVFHFERKLGVATARANRASANFNALPW